MDELKTFNGLKSGDIVNYYGERRIIHSVYNEKSVSLCLIDYDDTEEDFQVDAAELILFCDIKEYKVVYEIQVHAKSPLKAAKTVLEYIKDKESLAHAFLVQEENDDVNVKMPIFSVDLDEENEDAVLEVANHESLIK